MTEFKWDGKGLASRSIQVGFPEYLSLPRGNCRFYLEKNRRTAFDGYFWSLLVKR
jgi:hypothetical protein